MSSTTMHKIWAGIGAIALLAAACTTKVAEETTGEGAGGAGAGNTNTAGSGGDGGSLVDITQEVQLSDCGGFQPLSGSGDSGDSGGAPPPYCDAEVLYWFYDAANQELSLSDSRVELNCCGDHAMVVEKLGDSLVVTETDAPEGGGGRCDCMCVFDYAATAAPVEQGVFQVELIRHVTDSGSPVSVWQGSIDLSEGSGFVVIDDEPSFWCEHEEPLPS